MDSMSYAVTDEAVENLMSFVPEIFDAHFVRDVAVRRQVCLQLLSDASFVQYVADRFDLDEALNNGGILGRNFENQETAKPTVSIYVGLKSAQKALLVNNNLDYNIVFKDGNTAPHALAYAQRIVDTARCKASMNYRRGMVIDIGGNYATHAMSGAVRIHSCTLRNDVEEGHRQTQRDVLIELGDFDAPSMCTVGVENCDVMASEAFSLHTLPRINPDSIVDIFLGHNLDFVTGVHHYDILMDTHKSGYMSDLEMHWKIEEGIVDFFFEGDSSYGYTHRHDWLRQYSVNGFFSKPSVEFVVYYCVDRISCGMVYWSMIKLDKQTIGTQVIPPQYRYTNNDEFLTIQVPVYDEKSSFPITDPRSYGLESVVVPVQMFAYLYKTAMSNDTARPDLPLSLDETRNFAHTYNNVREVNGTSITTTQRLSTSHIDKIARGMYLIVVQRATQMRVIATEYTKMFSRIQKRWGDENFLYLAMKCFSWAAVSPFVMMAEDLTQITDLMAVHMRSVVRESKTVASVMEELPYYLVSPVREVVGRANARFQKERIEVTTEIDIGSEDVDIEQFYNVFKDELQPQHANVLKQRIAEQKEKAEQMVVDALNHQSLLPEVEDTRESWEAASEYIAKNVPIPTNISVVEASRDQVLKDVQLQIYEAGLYNMDVGLNVIANAIERCAELWTGTSYRDINLTTRNNTTDLEIRFLKVNNGVIQADQGAEEYSVSLDPNTNMLLHMPVEDSMLKLPTQSDYVFVYKPFKVFVNLRLANRLVSFARSMTSIHQYELKLVDGVPGCGKTHEIVEKMTEEDLVACAVKDTAEDTKRRVLKSKPNIQSHRLRTADSCVMHTVPRAKRVFIDEGLLLLPGVIHYIAQNAKAEVVEVYGDSAQIGFIDRGSKLGLLRFQKLSEWESVEYRNVTMRVPADACAVMRRFYPEWRRSSIVTQNPVRRSVTFEHVPEIENPVYTVPEKGVPIMTITISDKDKILRKPGFLSAKTPNLSSDASTVLTVHEAQGSTKSHTTVARMNTFANPIFASDPHLLVALTRHTHTLKVVSTVSQFDDPMMILAQKASVVSEEEMDSCQITPQDWIVERFSTVKERGI